MKSITFRIFFFTVLLSCSVSKEKVEFKNERVHQQVLDFLKSLPEHPFYKKNEPKEVLLSIEKISEDKYRVGMSQYLLNKSFCEKFELISISEIDDYDIVVLVNQNSSLFFRFNETISCDSISHNYFRDKFPMRGFDINSKGEIIDSIASWQWK